MLYKVEMTIINIDKEWLARRMTGAMRLEGVDGDKSLKATAGARNDSQRLAHIFANDNAWIGVAHLLGARLCHYLHTDAFGRIDKEGPRRNEDADKRGSGKRPNEERSRGHERKQNKNIPRSKKFKQKT